MIVTKLTDERTKMYTSFKKLYSKRYLNGGLLIKSFDYDSTAEWNELFRVFVKFGTKHRIIFDHPTIQAEFKELGEEIYNLENKLNHYSAHTNGFALVSKLAYQLSLGGCYANHFGFEIPARDCLKIAIKFVEEFIHDEFDRLWIIEMPGVKWSSWFYQEYLSDTTLVFDNKNKILHFFMLRDTD